MAKAIHFKIPEDDAEMLMAEAGARRLDRSQLLRGLIEAIITEDREQALNRFCSLYDMGCFATVGDSFRMADVKD